MILIDVSVIVPCFNAARTIERTVSSILVQKVSLEIIIIDDCSVDNSAELLNTLAGGHPEVRILKSQFNSGPGYCRNLGLDAARGQYIAFLDADDFWLPDKLAPQIHFMRSNDFEFSFHDYYEAVICGSHIIEAKLIRAPDMAELPTYFFKRGFGMCLTSVIKKTAIGSLRFPDDRTISSEDYGFFLRVLSSGVRGHRLPLALGVYTVALRSRSSNKIRQAISVLKCNIRESNKNFLGAIYYFLVYVFYQIKSRFSKGQDSDDDMSFDAPETILVSIRNCSLQQYLR